MQIVPVKILYFSTSKYTTFLLVLLVLFLVAKLIHIEIGTCNKLNV